MQNRVTLVKGYNWQGLYVNFKLVDQHFSIPEEVVNEHLKDGGDFRIFYAHNEWLNYMGYFPERYDLVWFEGEKWK